MQLHNTENLAFDFTNYLLVGYNKEEGVKRNSTYD